MERLFEQFKIYLLTEKRVSTNTLEAYSADLRQLFDFLSERMSTPESVRSTDLRDFLAHIKQQNLSPRTMSRKVSSIKAFFGYAQRYHGVDNSAESLIFPKLDKRLPKCLSENEVEALLVAASADTISSHCLRNRVILSLLYVTGMRISELIGLSVTDIREDVNLLAVKGKGGKGRLIPVPREIILLIHEYREKIGQKMRARQSATEIPYLFPILYAGKIKPMTRQACWAIIKKIWATTGIQKTISPHVLRHSLATHLLKNGVDLRSLQLLLGHENLSTVQVYTHLDTSYVRSIYDAKHPRS